MPNPDWNARARRASELIAQVPAAAELLRFYANLAEFQGQVYARVASQATADPQRPLRGQLDLDRLTPFVPELFRITKAHGPARLSEASNRFSAEPGKLRELQMDYVAGLDSEDPVGTFFARVLIEPYAEHLATQIPLRHLQAVGSCPVCTGKPLLGVLRPEGEGARRSLVCSFCLTEWEFRRVVCPVCGEEGHGKLPVYTAEELPHVRVESCDTCKHYLLAIDLSKTGLAVPLADEVSAASLNVWAGEKGYQKISPNLLRI